MNDIEQKEEATYEGWEYDESDNEETEHKSDEQGKCINEEILDLIESKEKITIKREDIPDLLKAFTILERTVMKSSEATEQDGDETE